MRLHGQTDRQTASQTDIDTPTKLIVTFRSIAEARRHTASHMRRRRWQTARRARRGPLKA
jgi:hypothetical protein